MFDTVGGDRHRHAAIDPGALCLDSGVLGGVGPAHPPRLPALLPARPVARTTRNPRGRTTTNDPDRTTPNGPGPAKRAMPAVRNTKPALAWRYPIRTPARVRITSPPTPGRATAASAATETATGRSLTACRRNDRTPIGMAPLGAGGAIPGSDDARPASLIAPKMDAAIPPSVAVPVLPATGTPGTPESGRTSRNCDATDAPAVADSPAPSMPPNPSSTGSTPAMPNKKEERSDCSCVSGTTAPATDVSMS